MTGIVRLYGSAADESAQRSALLGGDLPVAVYGLGKLGLPLAAVLADLTGNTVGVDIDESVVERVNSGDCHVEREPGLAELVADTVERGALRASTDPPEAAVHALVVPTLLEGESPDLSTLLAAADAVGSVLSPGDLVVVESTVPPGTCRERLVPRLAETSGLDPDAFGVACCPERTVSGQALADIRGTHPKVVGGVDAESTRAAELLYGEVTDNDVLAAPDAATAAATKVFEGVYRDVNLALANELAVLSQPLGVDANEAIDLANTQPFCALHDPGPGVGGHCIPVYPYFVIDQVGRDASLLRTARAVNDGMPRRAVELIERVLATTGTDLEEATVLLLGLTYKENIAELRNAPGPEIADRLSAAGARVLAVDPLVADWSAVAAEPVELAAALDREVDTVALVTAHDEFQDLDWAAFGAPVVDGHAAVEAPPEVPVYRIGGRWPGAGSGVDR